MTGFVTIGGDGFWIAIDPENPDIVYSEYQYGNAYRYNRSNGEVVYIRPQERKGNSPINGTGILHDSQSPFQYKTIHGCQQTI
jgi:hypothetical protein